MRAEPVAHAIVRWFAGGDDDLVPISGERFEVHAVEEGPAEEVGGEHLEGDRVGALVEKLRLKGDTEQRLIEVVRDSLRRQTI